MLQLIRHTTQYTQLVMTRTLCQAMTLTLMQHTVQIRTHMLHTLHTDTDTIPTLALHMQMHMGIPMHMTLTHTLRMDTTLMLFMGKIPTPHKQAIPTRPHTHTVQLLMR